MRRSVLLSLVSLLIATVVLSACGAPAGASISGDKTGAKTGAKTGVQMGAVSALPATMQKAPARVREAYQFALANPSALENVPCYCGCGAMGHTSNLSCYIKANKPDGQTPAGADVEFDEHALGCSICVDIAQDVMRMTGEGKSPKEINTAIVNAYSQFGPGNQ